MMMMMMMMMIFGMLRIRMFTQSANDLIENFRGFPQSCQSNAGKIALN